MENVGVKKINILMTTVIVFISVFLVGFTYFPGLLGFKTFSIETESMTPTINKGSLVYVKGYKNFEDYQVGDIVTFRNRESTKNFTHRIVGINGSSKSFDTKGDANKEEDLQPTEYSYAVGKVEFSVPYLGYAVMFMRKTVAKVVVGIIYIAWIAIEIEVFIAERKRREYE